MKRAFMHFAGSNDKIDRLYCDNAKELEKAAAEELGWRVDTSTPYRHTSNGVAERSNRRVIDGARTLLHASGLPHCFWGYACQCYCTLRMSTMRTGTPRRPTRTVMAHYFTDY